MISVTKAQREILFILNPKSGKAFDEMKALDLDPNHQQNEAARWMVYGQRQVVLQALRTAVLLAGSGPVEAEKK